MALRKTTIEAIPVLHSIHLFVFSSVDLQGYDLCTVNPYPYKFLTRTPDRTFFDSMSTLIVLEVPACSTLILDHINLVYGRMGRDGDKI
jgi:hypothetical protein